MVLPQNGLSLGFAEPAESNKVWPMAQIMSASVFVTPQAPRLQE